VQAKCDEEEKAIWRHRWVAAIHYGTNGMRVAGGSKQWTATLEADNWGREDPPEKT